jgi:hypothetical protein
VSIVLLRIFVTTRTTALSRFLQVACVLAACLAVASPAEAYLDPGTGNMLLSAIIGVAAAVGLAVKMFWYRLIGLIRGKPRGSRPGVVDGPPAADE